METRYASFQRTRVTPQDAAEIIEVRRLAALLIKHLDDKLDDISVAHVHGAASKKIQDIVSRLLTTELGFKEEVVLTAELGLVTRARPDFYFRLAPRRGILAEVERGGTTTNNHDLKDFWKAHIAPDAQHLFLIVPMANWNAAGRAREKPFARVCKRLGAFFGSDRREVDVLSVHIFGYGTT